MNFEQKLNEYVQIINDELEQLFPESSQTYRIVNDAMRYSLQAGGKRLRPVLTLSICEMLGGDLQNALPFASAIESIHTSSLIHDDLPCMDDDAIRRGKPSCHIAFGEANALLAGDALILRAFEIICASGEKYHIPPQTIIQAGKILASLSGIHGMVGGQTIDLAYENKEIDISLLQQMHLLKTGALIKAACLMGGVAAQADSDTLKVLGEYAENLGLAFQVCDDILDITGNEGKLGKPIGSDAQAKKSNFVSELGLDNAKKWAKQYTSLALERLQNFSNNEFLLFLTNSLLNREC